MKDLQKRWIRKAVEFIKSRAIQQNDSALNAIADLFCMVFSDIESLQDQIDEIAADAAFSEDDDWYKLFLDRITDN